MASGELPIGPYPGSQPPCDSHLLISSAVTSEVPELLRRLTARKGWTLKRAADALGSSYASVSKWRAGSGTPSPEQIEKLEELVREAGSVIDKPFGSTGIRHRSVVGIPGQLSLELTPPVKMLPKPGPPLLDRLSVDSAFLTDRTASLQEVLAKNSAPAETVNVPPAGGMSAGKNTYTYDAHTYHTKVPPQGIAELLRHYLPKGGLVIDPFAGSGMTGVAAALANCDCILNELSPAACFIESQFLSSPPPERVKAAVNQIVVSLDDLRRQLYSTRCRECGSHTELLYTVWSYRVACSECAHDFNLWDVCRSYGRTVREHKILTEFDCPNCRAHLKKSRLERSFAEPVLVGYKCCGSRQTEVTHPPDQADLDLIKHIETSALLADCWYPTVELGEGVNLGQPKRHGLTSVDRFYTTRNLIALSHLWDCVQRIADDSLAGQAAFAFTSLYRRVTKFSEFRFWGGSGNTARLNVPFIYDEPNIFISYLRKARTILDHLESTAGRYSRSVVIRNGSATDFSDIPNNSVDLVFTDPPFGSNINYSEMNLLWESWLGRFTDNTEEAIVNHVQGKDVEEYQKLMTRSLEEAFRVLRPGHWMLLVFMNSSARVWHALEESIRDAGFVVVKADVFDKQHGTFKHFVSPNTAGADLVLHCLKPSRSPKPAARVSQDMDIEDFLEVINVGEYLQPYLHVSRPSELDLRRLYSEWIAESMTSGGRILDFADFRRKATEWLDSNGSDKGFKQRQK